MQGWVHDCLQGVMRAEAASPRIAIWPVGTGNDIDRGLRLTKNRTLTEPTTAGGEPAAHSEAPAPSIDSFIDAVTDQRFRSIDVGSVQCGNALAHYFLGVLSCGFDSDVNDVVGGISGHLPAARSTEASALGGTT